MQPSDSYALVSKKDADEFVRAIEEIKREMLAPSELEELLGIQNVAEEDKNFEIFGFLQRKVSPTITMSAKPSANGRATRWATNERRANAWATSGSATGWPRTGSTWNQTPPNRPPSGRSAIYVARDDPSGNCRCPQQPVLPNAPGDSLAAGIGGAGTQASLPAKTAGRGFCPARSVFGVSVNL